MKAPKEINDNDNLNDNDNENENDNENDNNNGAPRFARGDASSTNTNDNDNTNDNENDSDTKVESFFIQRFREVVEARMGDSNLSVEDLAADMNLSRIQLYRKVKTVTGSSPVELLRRARLKHAYELLLTTDKSVSEVAYAVGFTAPSYFTKCFKEEYGIVPGDVRNK
jgi:AraC-like DNA-binding protein